MLTPVPAHVEIKRYPARVARGAHKPRIANRGDAPTFGHAARATSVIVAAGDRRSLLARAASNSRK